jgi:hypothetical protein
MALTRNRLAQLLALAALALSVPACSLPVQPPGQSIYCCPAPPIEPSTPAIPDDKEGSAAAPYPVDFPASMGEAQVDLSPLPPQGREVSREGESPYSVLSTPARAIFAAVPGQPGHEPAEASTTSPLIRQVRADLPAPGPSAPGAPPVKDGYAPGQVLCVSTEAGADLPPPESVFWERLGRDIDLSLQDYCNYYSWTNLGLLALGVGTTGAIANTAADRDIRQRYQHSYGGRIRSVAEVFNYGGQIWVALPVGVELAALCGKAPDDYTTDGGLFEWSNRSLRAIAVGFPPVIAMYGLLGASRPDRNDSRWHPFNDIHGVSGHTFIGAVPFLTAASMTDNPWLKYPLYVGSFLTGWARFHEDRHYFSQVALGWWSGVLAVCSVNQTEDQRRSLSVGPMVMPGGAGMGVEMHY